jgi:hypothetical protein
MNKFNNILNNFFELMKPLIMFLKSFRNARWTQKKSNSLFFLTILIWVFFFTLQASPEISQTSFGFYLTLLITALVPTCILLILLTENRIFKILSKSLWIKFIYVVLVYIYIAIAYSWAKSTVSDVMHLSPSLFPLTVKLLVLEFFTIAVLQPISILGDITTILGSTFFIIIIALIGNWRSKLRIISIVVFALITLAIIKVPISLFVMNKAGIVKKIAVDFDFNENNLCMSAGKEKRIGALRLNNHQILEAYDTGQLNYLIKISKCITN